MRRLGALLVATTLFVVGLWATPAAAAPPSNDRQSGAIAIGGLPFTTTQDTSEATAGGPRFCASRASVFYSFTPVSTDQVQIDTIGSDYDTTLAVYRRTNTGRVRALACDDDAFGFTSGVRFRAVAGKTYFVMVGQCCSNVGGGGGELVLTATEVVDVPLEITFDVTGGSVDQATGLPTVNGTLTCNERVFVFRDMALRQFRDNFFVARGFFGLEVGASRGSSSSGRWRSTPKRVSRSGPVRRPFGPSSSSRPTDSQTPSRTRHCPTSRSRSPDHRSVTEGEVVR